MGACPSHCVARFLVVFSALPRRPGLSDLQVLIRDAAHYLI
jgi:hypothetical protein